jgi:hypothetical protein
MAHWQTDSSPSSQPIHWVARRQHSDGRRRKAARRFLPIVLVLEEKALLSTPTIITVAGNHTQGYSGDGGPATSAELFGASGVAVDSSGDLFIADTYSDVIREVSAGTGVITTVAGGGIPTITMGDGGPATAADMVQPYNIAVDSQGNLFIADDGNGAIREVSTSSGIINTVAGMIAEPGSSGDGGLATNAKLNEPFGVAVDSRGDIFITGNEVVREVNASTGVITTVAGNGGAGYTGDGGPTTAAELNQPEGIAVDAHGDLFIADYGNNVIREVNASTGTITTVAGGGKSGGTGIGDGGPATSAELSSPHSVVVDSQGNLFISDSGHNVIREVNASTGIITTVVGNGAQGSAGDGGPAIGAELDNPFGLALDAHGDLFIADVGLTVPNSSSSPAPTPTPTPTPTPLPTPAPGARPFVKVRSASLVSIKTSPHTSITGVEVHFSGALDPSDAGKTNVYFLTTIPRKKHVTGVYVSIASAMYKPTKLTVLLVPTVHLARNQPIRLTIVAAGLLDAEGRPLDGGLNFVGVVK